MPAAAGTPSDKQIQVCSGRLDSKPPTDDSSALVRRVTGPEAKELFFVCRPECATADLGEQAQSAYRTMLRRLVSESVSLADITSETLFVGNIGSDLAVIAEARQRVIEAAGLEHGPPVTVAVEQPPLESGLKLELSVVALAPHRPQLGTVSDVWSDAGSNGESAPRLQARLVAVGDQLQLHAGNIYGCGDNAFEETYSMFCAAEGLLHAAGMSFGEVVRTWIYLRDMDRDYAEFNRARRDFFASRGIDLKPASTAIGGASCLAGRDFSLRLFALKAARPPLVEVMSCPTLNEAWAYGSDFSRGLKVEEANKLALYVSGTASIDEAGHSVHVGDLEAQAQRMLANISSLLAVHGASFADLVSAVTYLKNPDDAPRLRALFREQGFEGFPCSLVAADVCRPELLCETEAVAALPLPGSRE